MLELPNRCQLVNFGLPSLSPFAKDKANLALFETKEMPPLEQRGYTQEEKGRFESLSLHKHCCWRFHNVAVDSTITMGMGQAIIRPVR